MVDYGLVSKEVRKTYKVGSSCLPCVVSIFAHFIISMSFEAQ